MKIVKYQKWTMRRRIWIWINRVMDLIRMIVIMKKDCINNNKFINNIIVTTTTIII